MTRTETHWNDLNQHVREIEHLISVQALLGWDQQVNLPPQAHAARGEQSALMSSLVHDRMSSARIGSLLSELEGADDVSALQRAGLRVLRRQHDRAVKVPADLASAMAKASALGFQTWHEARTQKDFSRFAPSLVELVDLSRQTAAAINPDVHPYDALLNDYDPGCTSVQLDDIFGRLHEGLRELLGAIQGVELSGAADLEMEEGLQRAMYQEVTRAVGYDLEAGRIDDAAHPFTINLGEGDVRITTTVDTNNMMSGLGATLHEAGHGMYEQGIPGEFRGTGLRAAASLGVHESQSRFWENAIGRSRAFMNWYASRLAEQPGAPGYSGEQLYRAANRVEPGLIRIFADEVTYNLHIIIRYRIERALMGGDMEVADIPAEWNRAYREALGVNPPDDGVGCLQDVHWSSGSFGYFPSYTLGNLYAAALGSRMERELPDLWEHVGQGSFEPVLRWLRTHVHERGAQLDGADLIQDIVGEIDLVDNMLGYLWDRHGALYGVSR